MPEKMLVRIHPNNNRETHSAHGVTIKKSGGWYEVPAGLAQRLREERMNPLNPGGSPPVFDVRTPEEARAVVEQEHVIADPAGTVDRPRSAVGSNTLPTAPQGKGRKGYREDT